MRLIGKNLKAIFDGRIIKELPRSGLWSRGKNMNAYRISVSGFVFARDLLILLCVFQTFFFLFSFFIVSCSVGLSRRVEESSVALSVGGATLRGSFVRVHPYR